MRMVLITAWYTMSGSYIHSASGTLSIRSNPLNLCVTSCSPCHCPRLCAARQHRKWARGDLVYHGQAPRASLPRAATCLRGLGNVPESRCYYIAAAAAKLLQSCPTPCDPIDGSPSGSPIPGILQARTLEWLPFPSPIHESEKWKWSHSVVSDS